MFRLICAPAAAARDTLLCSNVELDVRGVYVQPTGQSEVSFVLGSRSQTRLLSPAVPVHSAGDITISAFVTLLFGSTAAFILTRLLQVVGGVYEQAPAASHVAASALAPAHAATVAVMQALET